MKLLINDIHKFYGEKESRIEVLKGIDCEIDDGEICVLLGPSGSGKSTLLNIIGGLESADSGCIDIGDFCTDNMNEKELSNYRRNNLGFVFQFYNLIPNLTIKENIEVCAYLSKEPLDIDELLDTLGLTEHKDKFPNQLSGGQQQRCAIGRALVKNPQILLCDEPTGALDYTTSKDILELIEKINRKYHNTIIIVTHNQAISGMADRILKLRDGKITSNKMNENKIAAKELEW
ncbi:MAG: ABC transporter ATP-binding protein [Butyrivibrio sp.]